MKEVNSAVVITTGINPWVDRGQVLTKFVKVGDFYIEVPGPVITPGMGNKARGKDCADSDIYLRQKKIFEDMTARLMPDNHMNE